MQSSTRRKDEGGIQLRYTMITGRSVVKRNQNI